MTNETPANAAPDAASPDQSAPEPTGGALAAAPASEPAAAGEPGPAAAPAPAPAAPTPSNTRLTSAGIACLAAAREGRCLYRAKAGYSLSGTGGKQHTFPVVDALVKAGLLLKVPSGGSHGSVKITDRGVKALKAHQAARRSAAS